MIILLIVFGFVVGGVVVVLGVGVVVVVDIGLMVEIYWWLFEEMIRIFY